MSCPQRFACSSWSVALSFRHCTGLTRPHHPPYDYPFDNPWTATVLGTPEALRVPLAEDPEFDHRTLTVFETREVPEGFWHNDRLHYSTFLQDHEAPLIFVIAGTGADDQSL
jgi:hypothetical protein